MDRLVDFFANLRGLEQSGANHRPNCSPFSTLQSGRYARLKRSIWFISDTHCRHEELSVPDVDMVIHCGDESNCGDPWYNEHESRDFFDWYCALPISWRVFVPGNHSTAIEKGIVKPSDYPSVHFLIHESLDWSGLKLFGSPYTPTFFDWAYMRDRSKLDAIWAKIPTDTDILMTHGPPKGILDMTRDMDTREPIHVGSNSLRKHVETWIKPIYHAFGHIHDERSINNFGRLEFNETIYINCSCCDLEGQLKNHGLVVEVDVKEESKHGQD